MSVEQGMGSEVQTGLNDTEHTIDGDVIPKTDDVLNENISCMNGPGEGQEKSDDLKNAANEETEKDSEVRKDGADILEVVTKGAQSEDSDTETFEDAGVVVAENGIADNMREKITPERDSTEEDSEAFFDVESDADEKSTES